jgi:hypothetical protein
VSDFRPFFYNFRRIIIGYEAFICCYFDQEDRDCVCVQKTHALFRSNFSYEILMVNFCKNSSAAGVCGTSLLGRRGGGGEKIKLSSFLAETLNPASRRAHIRRLLGCFKWIPNVNAQ